MAAQQGFQYEINAANVLKKLNITPKNFSPAGAGHDQPDLMIMKDGKEAGCELKISAASAGSLVLKYDVKRGWGFNPIDRTEKEKLFIKDLADDVGLFKIIDKQWTELPAKRDRANKDATWKAFFGNMSNKEMYERDLKLFKDIKGEIPATKIEQYYNKKDTYYVNVGTHGFYLMGSKNPLKLKDVPMFSRAAKATYRARVQYKGSGNYQYSFEMQFSIPSGKKSPFNIAPVRGKSVTIIESDLALGCFA